MFKWEKPVYKCLAASELGVGHTSGVVPTVNTQPYFGTPQRTESHLLRKIFIEFWIGKRSKIITTNVNYFKSGTHDHIHLTGNLLPAYKAGGASVGDVLVFWKSNADENYFKAELIKPKSVRWMMITEPGFPEVGGSITLSPPGKDSLLVEADEEDEDYEVLSEIEETLTPADFPTMNRRGRREQDARMITIRNKAKGDFVLKQQNYKCQVEPTHASFITPAGVRYMEKHHLISMRFYEEFEKDLDDICNIVSLCPTCHKQIHLGRKEEIGKILDILYMIQGKALKSAGFKVDLSELKRKYGAI